VLARAKSVLAKLEEGRAATGGIAAGLDDLPLFAAAAAQAEEEEADALHAAIAEVDADALSPREALELVYRLKRIAADAG
jgi:DNA mismatch repair protein MutS